MPESRHRQGHPYQKKAAIPARQRVKGRVIWAILFCIFGLLISYFAAGTNYIVLVVVAAICTIIGFVIGKHMEQDA